MTPTQIATIEQIVDHIENGGAHREPYSIAEFVTRPMRGGNICVQIDTKYGEKGHALLDEMYQVFVGPRGGITQYDAQKRAIVSRKYVCQIRSM